MIKTNPKDLKTGDLILLLSTERDNHLIPDFRSFIYLVVEKMHPSMGNFVVYQILNIKGTQLFGRGKMMEMPFRSYRS